MIITDQLEFVHLFVICRCIWHPLEIRCWLHVLIKTPRATFSNEINALLHVLSIIKFYSEDNPQYLQWQQNWHHDNSRISSAVTRPLNIKMPSYQYRKSHCGDKTILRPSYFHNGISYTGKMASLYWISPQKPPSRNTVHHNVIAPVWIYRCKKTRPKTDSDNNNCNLSGN